MGLSNNYGPIQKNDVSDSAKSVKQLIHKAKAIAKDKIDAKELMKMAQEPDQIEKLTRNLQPILQSGMSTIEDNIKKETGYTLQEIRYKTVDIYQLKHEIEQEGNEKEEKAEQKENGGELEEKKARSISDKKKLLKEKIQKLPDEMYNAFYLSEINNIFDKAKTMVDQSRDIGTQLIDTVSKEFDYIKDNFKLGDALTEIKHGMQYGFEIDTDSVNSGIDTSEEGYSVDSSMDTQFVNENPTEDIDEYLMNDALLKELAKSKQTERGEVVEEFKHKTCDTANSAMSIISSVGPIMALLKTLCTNYKTNKASIKKDTDQMTNMLLQEHAQIFGLEGNVPSKDVQDALMTGIKGWDDKDRSEEEIPLINPLNDNQTALFYPNNDVAYISSDSTIISELDRLNNALDKAQRYCKLNLNYPLKSLSTIHDGGKVENLKHSGNDRYEMIDAIEALNGGARL